MSLSRSTKDERLAEGEFLAYMYNSRGALNAAMMFIELNSFLYPASRDQIQKSLRMACKEMTHAIVMASREMPVEEVD